MYRNYIKRMIDLILSSVGIVVLIPFWIVIGIAIKMDDPGPIFFKQKRIAKDKNGEKQFFQIYKYRSMKMCTPHDTPTHLLENPEQYITRVGGFLRKTSLDELPQLINIIKGDLSIIGPRPVIAEELEKYGHNMDKFLSVTPGLTGYWAANGRSNTTYEQRMEMELYYVDNISFKMDLKVFFKTIESVIKKEGAI